MKSASAVCVDVSGMAVAEAMRACQNQLATSPVVAKVAHGDTSMLAACLRIGCFYVVESNVDPSLLTTILACAPCEPRPDGTASCGLALLQRAEFKLRRVGEVIDLATSLSELCAQPQHAMLGLVELLMNAIEHGNLGIDERTKSTMLARGDYHAEVARRLEDAAYRDRWVTVTAHREGPLLVITITDAGEGFDWSAVVGRDPDRQGDLSGRGIALARLMAFPQLRYNERGNAVTVKAVMR